MIEIKNKRVNQSFIKTADLIISNGIVNNLSYLFKERTYSYDDIVYDGKNQIDANKLMLDCETDIYYFMREVMKLPNMGGGSIQYQLDPANLIEINMLNKSRKMSIWKTKPRQTMNSLSTYCLLIYDRIFHNRKFVIVCRTKKDIEEQSKRINEVIKLLPNIIRNSVPSYDYFDWFLIESDDMSWNFANHCINNGLNIVVNDGEFVKYLYPMILRYSMRDDNDDCRSFLSVNSTINNTKSADKRLINLIENITIPPFTPFEMGSDDILNNYGNMMIRVQYDYIDLGYDESWFNNQKIMLNNDEKIIKSEVLLRRKQ